MYEQLCVKTDFFFPDCVSLLAGGHTDDGVYCIDPDNSGAFEAYCDMASGGWTVFQRRIDDSVDFYRGWDDYVAGFGDLESNFWAGLDHLRSMTSTSAYQVDILITMETFDGASYEAKYSTFSIGDCASRYKLTVDGYSGTAGNHFNYNNGKEFSTFDFGSKKSCGSQRKSGFWFDTCTWFNPNGPYLPLSDGACSGYTNIMYYNYRCLKAVAMKIRRKS